MSSPQARSGCLAAGRPAFAAGATGEPLQKRLLALLAPRPDDLLVQLGCARPGCLIALAKLVPLRYQALVVDPSPGACRECASEPTLRVVAMEPLRFAAYPIQCDRMLLEDGLLQGDHGPKLASLLFARLNSAGRLVAVASSPVPGPLPPDGTNGGRCDPAHPTAGGVARVLEDVGFAVRSEAAQVDGQCLELVLAVKAATSG